MHRWSMFCAPLAGLALALAGCSHTTTINAGSDAKIYVDGQAKGVGSASADVGNGMGGSFKIKVEKPGAEPLEAEVSRGPIAWGALGTAIGGCLGGGCLGALIGGVGGALTTLPIVPIFTIPCCALFAGVPFLWFVFYMNQAPDKIDVDLENRIVKTTPSVDVKILGPGGAVAPGATPDKPADKPSDKPGDVKPEQPDKPVVQPFDY